MVFIFDPILDDREVEQEIEKIKSLVTAEGGEVVGIDPWGRRKLSYEIKKKRDGYYLLMNCKLGSSSVLKELERVCKLNESILRYLAFRSKPISSN